MAGPDPNPEDFLAPRTPLFAATHWSVVLAAGGNDAVVCGRGSGRMD